VGDDTKGIDAVGFKRFQPSLGENLANSGTNTRSFIPETHANCTEDAITTWNIGVRDALLREDIIACQFTKDDYAGGKIQSKIPV
jgi:hypothetical protein